MRCHGGAIYQPPDDEGPRGPGVASVVTVPKLYKVRRVRSESNAADYQPDEDGAEGKFADSFDGSGKGSQGNVRESVAAVRDCRSNVEGDLQTLAIERLSVYRVLGRGVSDLPGHWTGGDSGEFAGGAG